jgi:hypothetical protein
MEYYSAIKNSDILSFVAALVELETFSLIEINWAQKYKYHMISLR